MTQLIEALRYKSEGHGFDSRWSHWYFSLTQFFRPHYSQMFDSVCNRNEHQGYLLGGGEGGKGGRCIGLTTSPPSCANCLEMLGASTSWNPKSLPRPVMGKRISNMWGVLLFVFFVIIKSDLTIVLLTLYKSFLFVLYIKVSELHAANLNGACSNPSYWYVSLLGVKFYFWTQYSIVPKSETVKLSGPLTDTVRYTWPKDTYHGKGTEKQSHMSHSQAKWEIIIRSDKIHIAQWECFSAYWRQ